ncbi:MAG: MMPL family transporter [Bacteroidota bacterium]
MWFTISRIILRNRVIIIALLTLITAFMAWEARTVKLHYKFGGILPTKDSAYIAYQNFIETFAEDGNVMVLGTNDKTLYNLNNFNAWYDLGEDLKALTVEIDSGDGRKFQVQIVDSVFSVANIYRLKRDDEKRRFILDKVIKEKPVTQEGLDTLIRNVKSLPFYDELLYNDNNNSSMMLLFVNNKLFSSEHRVKALNLVKDRVELFSQKHIKIHYSGLPFIRTLVAQKTKSEISLFSILAGVVSAVSLFWFFRSLQVTLYSMLIVGVCVIWGVGTIGLFGYKITAVMGLIPPLIIVLGIPNCVFLINEYHLEYIVHKNKVKALARMITKIGLANFLTNFNTAVGFAAFIFVSSPVLREFGVISTIASMVVFLVSLLLIPIIFSYLADPQPKHTSHLEKRWITLWTERLVYIVNHKRPAIYITTIAICILGVIGLFKIKSTGYMVDDLPQNDPILVDLKFFEKNFNGVMPFEILIDTKKKNGATKDNTLRKIEKAQELLKEYPAISKSLSIVDAVKFGRQAFYNGDPAEYKLIQSEEKSFIGPYITGTGNSAKKGGNLLKAFVDKDKQKTRITTHIADLGTVKLNTLIEELKPRLDSIFPADKYTVTLTGTSVVFLEGTNYLISDLVESVVLAIVGIALLMAFLFSSFRMIMVSFIPNFIPLILTAAIMGYWGITIKPSTILVFGIAFGIAIDNTIHYLAKYRYELKRNGWNIGLAVDEALRDAWVSIFYTSVILFFGFSVFAASEFGGTIALGILTATTIVVAMFTNIFLLPAILLSLDRAATTKAFRAEPLLVIYDEEDDIDYKGLEVEKPSKKTEE